MCVVSMVHDYAKQNWPINDIHWPPLEFDENRKKYHKLIDMIKRAEELDRIMKEPDCVDPEKEKYIQELEARLLKLEEKVKTFKGDNI
jgi:hypothetical protein